MDRAQALELLKIPAEELKKKKKLHMTRLKELEERRITAETVWQEIAYYVIPRLWDILDTGKDKHSKYGEYCYDGSPQGMLQLLADGLHGYLVSPSIVWFVLKMRRRVMASRMRSAVLARYATQGRRLDEIPEVRQYLEYSQEEMYGAYSQSNFYDAMSEYFLIGGSVGTADLYNEEDLRSDRLVYSCLHPREAFVAEDAYGRVDTVYRKFKITARQALQRCMGRGPQVWAIENLSDDLLNAVRTNRLDTEFEFIHAVFPRTDRDYNAVDGPNKPWASVWFQNDGREDPEGGSGLVHEWGYDTMPHSVWRWKKDTGRIYGASPAWDALVDILGANTMEKTLINAAELSVEPPMAVPSSMRDALRLHARGINYYDDPQKIPMPIETAGKYPVGIDHLERKRNIIEQHFKVDFFLMLSRAEKVMTATEILEKSGEKAAVLGTTIGRLQNECLDPVIDICFESLQRMGKLPEPPQILVDYIAATGQNRIDVDYMGPLAQAQKRLFRNQGILRTLEILAPVLQMEETTKDKIDWDATIEELMVNNGMPQRCIRSEESLRQIRESRAQAMAQEQNKMDMERGAGMVGQLAQADKATDGQLMQAAQQMLEQRGGTA
jgi:hypothetical protein